ncbi:unnamed protein product [Camellia sinensis]
MISKQHREERERSNLDEAGVVRSTGDEGLDETNAEKTEEVDEGSDEGGDGSEFGESDDVERGGGSDLIALTMEEVVSHREENVIGEGEVRH